MRSLDALASTGIWRDEGVIRAVEILDSARAPENLDHGVRPGDLRVFEQNFTIVPPHGGPRFGKRDLLPLIWPFQDNQRDVLSGREV